MRATNIARKILLRAGLLPLSSSASLRIMFFGILVAGVMLLAVYTEAFSFALPAFAVYLIILPIVLFYLLWRERSALKQSLTRTPVRVMIIILAIGFLLDGLSTLTFTSMWGIDSEANMVIVFLANHIGVLGTLILTSLWFVPIAGIMLSRYGKEKYVGLFIAFIGVAKIVASVYNFIRIYTIG